MEQEPRILIAITRVKDIYLKDIAEKPIFPLDTTYTIKEDGVYLNIGRFLRREINRLDSYFLVFEHKNISCSAIGVMAKKYQFFATLN